MMVGGGGGGGDDDDGGDGDGDEGDAVANPPKLCSGDEVSVA